MQNRSRPWLKSAPDDYLASVGFTREQLLADMADNDERNTKQCHAFVDWWLDDVVAEGDA